MRPPSGGVLGGVVEQVADDLRQPRPDRRRRSSGSARQLDAQRRARPASISGWRVSTARRRRRAGRAARGAARPCRVVMRETSSRSSTRRDEVARPGARSPRARCARGSAASSGCCEQMQRVADRRQRVAQLVGEHREELVLAAVGLAQRLSPRLRAQLVADLVLPRRPRSGRHRADSIGRVDAAGRAASRCRARSAVAAVERIGCRRRSAARSESRTTAAARRAPPARPAHPAGASASSVSTIAPTPPASISRASVVEVAHTTARDPGIAREGPRDLGVAPRRRAGSGRARRPTVVSRHHRSASRPRTCAGSSTSTGTPVRTPRKLRQRLAR